jgi:hypothetical protein
MLPILMYIGEVYGHSVWILVSVSSSAALITKGDTIMTEDTHFLKKLGKNLYKTAYSPLYNQYIKIDKVYSVAGEYIIKSTIEGQVVIFRPTELTQYCL